MNWGVDKIISFLQTATFKLLSVVTKISYWPCLIVCICGVLFYLVGIKKGRKYVVGSLLTYLILQCLKMAMK